MYISFQNVTNVQFDVFCVHFPFFEVFGAKLFGVSRLKTRHQEWGQGKSVPLPCTF